MGHYKHHKKNTKDILGVNKEAYHEANWQKRKYEYVLMSRHTNAGEYHYRNVAKFRFWGKNSNRCRT
jgi:hypothetical protein